MAFYAAGNYQVLIQQQGVGINEKTGNPYFFLGFLVVGQNDRVFDEADQQVRKYERAITEKTIPYLAQDVKTLGLSISTPAQLDPKYGQSIIGKTITMYCKWETDAKGKEWERWNVPQNGGGSVKTIMDESGLDALNKKFGAAFAAALAGDEKEPF